MPEMITTDRMVTLLFNEDEVAYYRRAAALRCLPKRQAGIPHGLVAKQLAGVDNDLLGLLGEAAVAEYLGLEVYTTDSLCGDGGVSDMEMNGCTIQIKTSWHRHGGLLFINRKYFKADVAVLCVTNKKLDGLVMILGWVTRKEFLERAVDRDLGYGPTAYLDQSLLNPIATLKPYLERRQF